MVLAVIFSGWVEAFPARTEIAAEVAQAKRNNSQVWTPRILTK